MTINKENLNSQNFQENSKEQPLDAIFLSGVCEQKTLVYLE